MDLTFFRDADTQADSVTIPLYTPITAPCCNMKLHCSSIPYMGYLITAEEVEGGVEGKGRVEGWGGARSTAS